MLKPYLLAAWLLTAAHCCAQDCAPVVPSEAGDCGNGFYAVREANMKAGREIYLFSGLGADERAYKELCFPADRTHFVRWIRPERNESIESYARRLSDSITAERPILIGLSFGGLIAIEVAKHIPTEKIILISSAKTRAEIPFYYRIAGRTGLYRLFPINMLRRPNRLSNWYFGAVTESDRRLLARILKDADPYMLRWGVKQLTSWKNTEVPERLRHIHGTSDHILPYRYIHCDVPVRGGGHFMTVNRADELAVEIAGLL